MRGRDVHTHKVNVSDFFPSNVDGSLALNFITLSASPSRFFGLHFVTYMGPIYMIKLGRCIGNEIQYCIQISWK